MNLSLMCPLIKMSKRINSSFIIYQNIPNIYIIIKRYFVMQIHYNHDMIRNLWKRVRVKLWLNSLRILFHSLHHHSCSIILLLLIPSDFPFEYWTLCKKYIITFLKLNRGDMEVIDCGSILMRFALSFLKCRL